MAGEPLRVGLLSGEKILPFVVAERAGLLGPGGVDVELSTAESAARRDADLLAGRLDIVLMNLVGVLALSLTGTRVTVLTVLASEPGPQGMFQLLAHATPVPSPARVGYSRHTIADYSASVLLPRAGLVRARQHLIDVPDLVRRGRDLVAGTLDLAILPAPIGDWCQERRAVLLADDRDLAPPPPTLCMLTPRLAERRVEVDAFLDAYAEAVRLANAEPERSAGLLAECGVPVGRGWRSPRFVERAAPTVVAVERTLAWCREIGLPGGSTPSGVPPTAAAALRAITLPGTGTTV
ncbi:ABC transporter substrate-binding protein [Micromonospora sp. NPDC020750]|uniref:ABC transporter substrate-binding protein n=1 Tax=unclassified Micromonospora TaxID=2617518 RepID=UPI0037889A21